MLTFNQAVKTRDHLGTQLNANSKLIGQFADRKGSGIATNTARRGKTPVFQK